MASPIDAALEFELPGLSRELKEQLLQLGLQHRRRSIAGGLLTLLSHFCSLDFPREILGEECHYSVLQCCEAGFVWIGCAGPLPP